MRHRLEREHGTWRGRNLTPPVGLGEYLGGEFGLWLRTAWSEIVGTTGLPDGHHLKLLEDDAAFHLLRGVDVAVMFWNDEAEERADRTRVAQYLAREAGKWRQKQPPPGFHRVGRYFGAWGRKVGFVPQMTAIPLEAAVAAEVEARLTRWVNWRIHVLRRSYEQTADPTAPRPLAGRMRGDGVTAFGLTADDAARIVAWSEKAVARKRERAGHVEVAGGEADGDLLALLRRVNPLTGELSPP